MRGIALLTVACPAVP